MKVLKQITVQMTKTIVEEFSATVEVDTWFVNDADLCDDLREKMVDYGLENDKFTEAKTCTDDDILFIEDAPVGIPAGFIADTDIDGVEFTPKD